MFHQYLDIRPEIAEAIHNKIAVVALESTIISHGMPYPQNVETAIAVEEAVKSSDAVPATIAIINGRIKAGLTTDELELLGKQGQKVMKCSSRDLPFVITQKQNGATTVAATMIIAQMAGIQVFATGGIGGVHRDVGESMDISADLQELAKTNVAVVCSGAKSILDIGRTVEHLETHGVPVVGYRTSSFPAFYLRDCDYAVPYRLNKPSQIAELIKMKWSLGLKGGVVVANPIPVEFEANADVVQKAIDHAFSDAKKENISGKGLTPFLLERVEQLTGGESLKSNIQLVLNNARLVGEIAVAMRRI